MSIAELTSTVSRPRAIARSPTATTAKFPAIEPGQLWLIEATADGAASLPARHAIDGANVVIYDRALAETLAEALPLGTYAEAATAGTADASASRCVRFSADGWSVVRLMAADLPQRQRAGRIRELVDALIAAGARNDLAVEVFAEAAEGIREHAETRLDQLARFVATHSRDARLTIVIAAPGGVAPRALVVAGNGLAG